MERLHFLIPNKDIAGVIVSELRSNGVSEDKIHVVAHDGIELDQLPEGNLSHKSDLIPALERGAVTGGVAGLLAGLAVIAFPPAGIIIGTGAALAGTIAGAGFGAWVSGMIGIRLPNTELKEYEQRIRAGELLMLVDVEDDRSQAVAGIIRQHHPEVDIKIGKPEIKEREARAYNEPPASQPPL